MVEERLPELVRRTHAAGLALLTDDADALPNVYLEDDEVRVDLLPLVAEALRPIATELEPYLPDVTLPGMVADGTGQERAQLREELTAALGRQLPDDLGQLTLMRRSALEEAQLIARSLDRSVWAAVFLAVVLVASSIAISPDRRRTIQQLALGVVAGLATTMVIILQVEGAILARITDPDGTRAVGSLLGQLVSDLRTVTLLVAVAALVVGIAARRSWRPSRTVTPHA